MLFKNRKNKEIEEYISDEDPTIEEVKDYPNNSEENLVEETAAQESILIRSSRLKKLHFWSDWPRKKRVLFFGGFAVGLTLLVSLIFAFVVRPARTNSYVNNSWYEVVSASSEIERTIKSEVNLEGTRDLADSLYAYNEKLNSITYTSSSKGNLVYTSRVKEFAGITEQMGEYYSSSATLLSKASSQDTELNTDQLEELKSSGEDLTLKINDFRQKSGLRQELNPDLLRLDVYISNVNIKKEEIEKEKADEEKRKKEEEIAAASKEAKDKSSVQSVTESYYKAFVNANESGIRNTLSKGFESEYDFGGLSAERRASFYPKGYRIIGIEKSADYYKVTSSVTYVSIYKDAEGNDVETSQPVTEIYRVVYSTETGSWKIDGRVEI